MQSETVEGFQLSPQQRHLWLLFQDDYSQAYRALCSILITGRLDRQMLRDALEDVVRRHEILRTVFCFLPEMTVPMQVIMENDLVEYVEDDISGEDEEKQERRIGKRLLQEQRHKVDFERGPLLRASLLALAPNRHLLILNLPGLCADVATLNNLLDEIARTYGATHPGERSSESNVQYADAAEWMNQLLESQGTEAGRAYWRKEEILSTLPPVIPFESTPPVGEPFSVEILTSRVDAARVGRMEEVLNKYGVAPADLLLTCWQILLWRLSGQSEIVVNAEFSGRRYAQLKNALGLFTKYLPIRSHVEDGLPFIDLLKQVSEVTNEAGTWQENFSCELLGERLPSKERIRFLPFAFAFHQLTPDLVIGDLTFSMRQQYVCTDYFSIRVCGLQQGNSLTIEWHYDPRRFSKDVVTRLAAEFLALLASAIDRPETAVGDLEVMSPAERQFLLSDVNSTRTDFGVQPLLHTLVEAQVERTSDAVAVTFEGENLTYRQLNERANQVAHRLRAHGVGPDVPVGVCAERSLEMVVGLLGVLKAGGAYLPLDPTLPRERLALMIGEVKPRLVLTQRRWRQELLVDEAALEYLEREEEEVSHEDTVNPAPAVDPDNLAYIIYTSGSTGHPKGAMISHRAICNRLLWMQQAYPLFTCDTLLQKTTFSFDASVWELFAPLLAGARLVLARPGAQQDSTYLVAAVIDHEITVLQLVPSMLGVLLKEKGIDACQSLRRVFCGGEALPMDLAREFHRLLDAALVNLYGPTEVAIDATSRDCVKYEMNRGLDKDGLVPIGRPIANLQVYILDQKLRLLPQGAAGELYIGGAGLARGYLNRPDLTVERFIPHPFSDEPGQRLYATGDMARHGADGGLEFLGRTDDQIKLRGFRVELGEIESALRLHERVREAVVTVQEGMPGDQRLVAYVVPRQEAAAEPQGNGAYSGSPNGGSAVGRGIQKSFEAEGWQQTMPDTATTFTDRSAVITPGPLLLEGRSPILSAGELQRYLKTKLPDYMLPSAFVLMDALPVLPSGKVNRKKLPKPDGVRLELEQAAVMPRTPTEEVVAGVWSEVLGIERLGVHHSFFELGGHSLLVMQVITRLQKAFQVELPLRILFERPTIATLSESIDDALREGAGLKMPPLIPAPRGKSLPLSFAQQRLWFLHQLNPRSTAYNISQAFRLSGPLNVPVLSRTLEEIVRRHESLRTTFTTRDGYPAQVVHPPTNVRLPLVDLRQLPATEREVECNRFVREEAQRIIDLENGPLWHALLAWISEEEHLVVFTMHHILSDGWSVGVLVREVAALYEAFLHGLPSPLPDLPIQYADFAHWQREWLQGEPLETQLAYWRHQLAESRPLALLTDRARPAIQTSRGGQQFFVIPPELSTAIKALARLEKATLFMTLLASFKALLYFYTRQTDISVGVPIAGRRHVETEKLIGFFVNTLVMRTDLSGDPSFNELLHQVRRVSLEAFAHQDLPFEILVEELRPERNLSHTPLFQVVFSLQNASAEVLELPELSLAPVQLDTATAKFDMTLNLLERETDLAGTLEYNTDLFEHSTISNLLEQLLILLAGVTAHPEHPISKLSLLSKEARHRLLVDRNATDSVCPTEVGIHHLFEDQAERTPEAIAIVHRKEEITYRELNQRANQLAQHLRSLSVETGQRVGIFLEHSSETPIAILGVLKTGAAYVPLDPEHPSARLAFIIEDADLQIVLTQQPLADRLPETRTRVLCLDSEREAIMRQSGDNSIRESTPAQLAYVIYTSGSTGQPKGVKIGHSSLVNYIWWAKDVYLRDDELDFALYSSLAFDLTVTSIFMPLITGRKLLVYGKGGPELALDAVVRENRVGILKLTPSHLMLLREHDNRNSRTKRLIVGGEALTTELAREVYESFGGQVEIFNEYGPTEATVGCMIYKFDPGDRRSFVPIGLPAANVRIYVLDKLRQPVGENLPGELYLAGDCLAEGYLNRPDLTAEKFIANQFEPGSRMYRSGDLARWLPEGQLEFLGREDEQVKFHAYRVELNEIRAALNRHPQVRDSVVIMTKNARGDNLLASYYVARQELEATALRDFLATMIIKETIPTVFIHLSKLPLTLNGKINYRALPSPEEVHESKKQQYFAPSTRVERILADIWAEVLGVEKVGANNNFFDLGGHSLLIVRVNSRLREALNQDVSLVNMFEYPTVKALAKYLTEKTGEQPPDGPNDTRGDLRRRSLNRQQQIMQRRRAAREQEEARNV